MGLQEGVGVKRQFLALAAVSVLFLVACGGSTTSGGKTQQAGTLTVGTGTDPDTLDPAAQTTGRVRDMVNLVVETLVQMNRQGKTVPDLATNWSMSPDGYGLRNEEIMTAFAEPA